MKLLFYKIVSLTMALVVVFSTMSFTINSHFCGDTLVSKSYFSKAKTCGVVKTKDTSNKECSIVKKNCCKDIAQLIKGQDKVKKAAFNSLSYDQQIFVATFYYSYISVLEALHNKVIPFKDYTPPLVTKNIQVLDQVYLI